MGATATSLVLSAVVAGVHLFAFLLLGLLPTSTKACCWAPLPMAPLPMVAVIDGGEAQKLGRPPNGSDRFAPTRRQRRRGGIVFPADRGSVRLRHGDCARLDAHLQRLSSRSRSARFGPRLAATGARHYRVGAPMGERGNGVRAGANSS